MSRMTCAALKSTDGLASPWIRTFTSVRRQKRTCKRNKVLKGEGLEDERVNFGRWCGTQPHRAGLRRTNSSQGSTWTFVWPRQETRVPGNSNSEWWSRTEHSTSLRNLSLKKRPSLANTLLINQKPISHSFRSLRSRKIPIQKRGDFVKIVPKTWTVAKSERKLACGTEAGRNPANTSYQKLIARTDRKKLKLHRNKFGASTKPRSLTE